LSLVNNVSTTFTAGIISQVYLVLEVPLESIPNSQSPSSWLRKRKVFFTDKSL